MNQLCCNGAAGVLCFQPNYLAIFKYKCMLRNDHISPCNISLASFTRVRYFIHFLAQPLQAFFQLQISHMVQSRLLFMMISEECGRRRLQYI